MQKANNLLEFNKQLFFKIFVKKGLTGL